MTTVNSDRAPLVARRHNRLRWIGGGFAAVLIVLILAVFVFPGSWLRAIINDKGSSKIGREFAIDGPLTLRWSHGLHIHAEKIRMANEKGLVEPNMLEIGALDVTIDVWKLFEFQLNMPELRVKDMKVILEERTPDDKNWNLPALSQGKAVTNAALPKSRHSFPVIGELAVEDGVLEFKDDPKQLDLKLKIDTVSGTSGGTKGTAGLKIDGQGTLQDKAFTLNAAGGSINMLRDTSKPYPLKLDLEMGATKIAVDGTFTDPVKMTGVDAHLSLKGDNLADLFYLTSIPLPPSPPYSIDGQLVKGSGVWSFKEFKGTVGHSDLEGNLKYDTSGKRGMVGATLVSRQLNFDDLRGFAGKAPKPGETGSAKQKANAEKQAASTKLIPDVPIKLNRLRATDMNVSLKAQKVLAPGWPLEDMDVRFNLKDGLLTIDPLRFGLAGGDLVGKAVLDGREDVSKVSMDITLQKLSLKQFIKNPKMAALSKGTFGGHFNLAGSGDSLAEVLGSSEGRVTMLMQGGQLSLLLVKAGGLDIASAGALFASGDNSATQIRCGIGDFNVKDGLLTSDILVFDTGDTSFTGGATINLKDQTIRAGIEASAKTPTLFAVDTPIQINGLLKKPSIGIDPKEAGARIGAAAVLGVLLTPVAAIIPFIEAGLGKDSDCGGLIAQAQAHDAQRSTHPHASPSSARTGEAPVTTAPSK